MASKFNIHLSIGSSLNDLSSVDDGIDQLQNYSHGNMHLCKEIFSFMRKRLKLEEEHNKSVMKLLKNSMMAIKDLIENEEGGNE